MRAQRGGGPPSRARRRSDLIAPIGILVALAGAFLLSFGSAVQQRGVAEIDERADHPRSGGLRLHQLLALVRTRRWLAGTAMVVGAIVCQLAALALAPIAVVQPVGVLALVITAIISARAARRPLGAPAVRALVVSVVAVAVFVALASATTRTSDVRDADIVAVLIVVGCGVLLVGIGYVVFRRRFTRLYYVVASGVLFGFVATLAKVILTRMGAALGDGDTILAIGVLGYASVAGIVVAGSLGQYFQQTAFRSGAPDVVVAGLTVIDPIVGATIGMSVLREAAGAPGWAFAVFGVAAALAVYGVVQLSRKRPDTG